MVLRGAILTLWCGTGSLILPSGNFVLEYSSFHSTSSDASGQWRKRLVRDKFFGRCSTFLDQIPHCLSSYFHFRLYPIGFKTGGSHRIVKIWSCVHLVSSFTTLKPSSNKSDLNMSNSKFARASLHNDHSWDKFSCL